MAASRERFSIYDFSAECWAAIDAFGDQVEGASLPTMSLDLWFHVEAVDLHRVVDLLPSLSWNGSLVGIRIEFGCSDEAALLTRFQEAQARASAIIRKAADEGGSIYRSSPQTLSDYLTESLGREFELRYCVLDHAHFDSSFVEVDGYVPCSLSSDKNNSGREVLNSLLRVDFLHAQRHLTDAASGGRAEDLSRCLSRFYNRNLQKREADQNTIRALADAEAQLNDHLGQVFEPTLQRLSDLGYPGLDNPRLLIKTSLNPATIMSSQDGARVHYALGDAQGSNDGPTLPDRYNGLGFKNLIYMVVELLDLHAQWMEIEENRPPMHLVFIEEPEAHLHAQLQQVFIRKVIDILSVEGDDAAYYRTQLVVSTHSPHILYERGFRPIRYFRRKSLAHSYTSEVLNLSAFYARTEHPTRDFLERYLKLMHCDLFFADAAILVEGNVERLLIPCMIEKSTPKLKSACLSILEIGGAFGHRFRSLIEFLGITALIVTDVDSVVATHTEPIAGSADIHPTHETSGDVEEVDTTKPPLRACMTHVVDAVTSNQTLIQWLPGKTTIAELLTASEQDRTQVRTEDARASVRVAYQTQIDVSWGGVTASLAGRTLEEAFAFENLSWCQDPDRTELKLRIPKSDKLTLGQLTESLHKRIKSTTFKKTDFALALLAEDPSAWVVPTYIAQGLRWLEDQVTQAPPAPVVAEVSIIA